ncbi:hypothetical protein EON65_53255 [archaeon]|nr:MAG: hypothetical protein EON65_53255 [archaeon]
MERSSGPRHPSQSFGMVEIARIVFSQPVGEDYDPVKLIYRKACASYINGIFIENVYPWPMDSAVDRCAFLRGGCIYLYNILDRGSRGDDEGKQADAIAASVAANVDVYQSVTQHMVAAGRNVAVTALQLEDLIHRVIAFRHGIGAHHDATYLYNISVRDVATATILLSTILLNYVWLASDANNVVTVSTQNPVVATDQDIFDAFERAYAAIENVHNDIDPFPAEDNDIIASAEKVFKANIHCENTKDFCLTIAVASHFVRCDRIPGAHGGSKKKKDKKGHKKQDPLRNNVIHMNYYYDVICFDIVDPSNYIVKYKCDAVATSRLLNDEIMKVVGW